jgi:hypothetical protein
MEFLQCSQWFQNDEDKSCIENAMRSAIVSIGADEGALLLPIADATQLEFEICCTRTGVNAMLVGQRVPASEGVVGRAMQTGEGQVSTPIFKNLIQADFTLSDYGNPASLIAVPATCRGVCVGVMTLATFNPDHHFSESDTSHLRALANLVASMLCKQFTVVELSGQLASADPADMKSRLQNAVRKLVVNSPGRIEGAAHILETLVALK